jgi:hypothetical protein
MWGMAVRMSRKPTDTVQLKLRFPEKLRVRIEAAAKKNSRSMNSEILRRLEQSFYAEDLNAVIQASAQATATAVMSSWHTTSGDHGAHTHTLTAEHAGAHSLTPAEPSGNPAVQSRKKKPARRKKR